MVFAVGVSEVRVENDDLLCDKVAPFEAVMLGDTVYHLDASEIRPHMLTLAEPWLAGPVSTKAYARVHRRERNFGDSPLSDCVGRGLVKYGSKKLVLQTPSIDGGGLMDDVFGRITPGM